MRYRFSILLTILTLGSSVFNSCQPEAISMDQPRVGSPRELVRTSIRRRVFDIIRPPADRVALTWDVIKGPAANVTFGNDGTVTMTGGDEIIIRSRETVSTDFTLEITVPPGFGDTAHLPYIGLDPYPPNPHSPIFWGMNSLTDKIRVDSQSTLFPVVAGDRILMEAKQGTVRYYRNFSAGSPPFYESRLPAIHPGASFPITIVKLVGGNGGDQWVAKQITLTR